VALSSLATPAFAETADISAADTAWMMVATALVLMMTRPCENVFSPPKTAGSWA
jgi:ammonium transporter, Amt family